MGDLLSGENGGESGDQVLRVESAPQGDDYVISQRNYEQEMIKRFNIESSLQYPNYKIAENDESPESRVTASDIKVAQSMAGALLWFITRTRPDIAVCCGSLQIGHQESGQVDRDLNIGDTVCAGES